MSQPTHSQPTTAPTGNRTNRNLFWSGASFALTAILNFGTLYILTQLLTPAAMAMVFISVIFQDLALLFVDNGMGSYIVQSDNLSQRDYASLFYQVLLFSSLLTLSLTGIAPWIATFFKSPPLASALSITAFSFIAIALSFPQKGLLQRNMHFKRIAMAEFMGMMLAAITTVFLAYHGFGFSSYLYGFLARRICEACILWQKDPWFPKPVWLWEPLKKLFGYSAFASSAFLLSYAVRLVDTSVVGRVLGVQVLGLYSLASNFIFVPVNKCVFTFSRVFIVDFSLAKHQIDDLRHAYADAMGKLYLLLLPGLTAIAILIPDIMRIFFKPTWLPVADLVRIMAFYGLLIAFLRMGEAILLALAHVCAVFIIYTTTILLTALLLLGGIHYGAAGAAWAVTLGAVPAIWMMYSALRNLQAFDWPLLLSRCQPGITAALLLAISTGLLQWILTPLIGRLAMLSIVALVDGLLFWIVFRYVKKRQHHNQQPIEAI